MDSQNLHRRHLSAETQKRLRAERVERVMHKRTVERKSLRVIAQEEGVSESQIRNDIKTAGAHPCAPAPAAPVELPERMQKVLEMKAEGHTDDAIAEDLGVSTKTVQRAKVDIAAKQHEAAKQQQEAAPKLTGRDGESD